MRLTETLLLGHACDGKWLTRKSRCQDIVIRNVFWLNLSDVSVWHLAKPCFVGFLRVPVPLTGERTLTSQLFERNAKSTEPGKQVNEGKGQTIRDGDLLRRRFKLQQWGLLHQAGAMQERENKFLL